MTEPIDLRELRRGSTVLLHTDAEPQSVIDYEVSRDHITGEPRLLLHLSRMRFNGAPPAEGTCWTPACACDGAGARPDAEGRPSCTRCGALWTQHGPAPQPQPQQEQGAPFDEALS